jgi:predicted metal-dependent hydrolase
MNAVKHMMEPDGFGDDLPVFMQMIEWHFVEELEHRTVAFDVYDHVCGGYFYRLVIGAWAQWHFTRWIRRATRYMLKVNPPPKRRAGEKTERSKSTPMIRPAKFSSLLPGLLRIYLPNYTPHNVKIAPGIQVLADKYTKMAIKTY